MNILLNHLSLRQLMKIDKDFALQQTSLRNQIDEISNIRMRVITEINKKKNTIREKE